MTEWLKHLREGDLVILSPHIGSGDFGDYGGAPDGDANRHQDLLHRLATEAA